MSSVDFEFVKSKLRVKLTAYLTLHDIEINRHNKWICFCPDHDDDNASVGIVPNTDGQAWHCFGCHQSGDIFHAAHYIEDLDISPANFRNALLHLLDQFEDLKEYKEVMITPEDIFRTTVLRITTEIHNFLRHGVTTDEEGKNLGETRKYIHSIQRGWTESTAKELGMASVPYKDVVEHIKRVVGVDISADQKLKDIFPPYMFNTDYLTISLLDPSNKPVGFARRDMNFIKGSSLQKYINTTNVQGVFKKEEYLYNLNNAKNHAKHSSLYVFEGYADVITAYQAGIKNCVAICGTFINEFHIHHMKTAGVRHITICTDNDKAGQNCIDSFIKRQLHLANEIGVDVVVIPLEGDKDKSDPDFFIKEHGAEAFLELPKEDLFTWRLNSFPRDMPGIKIAEEMTAFVALTPSAVAREEKVKQLAERTGCSIPYIEEDIRRYLHKEEEKLAHQRKVILEQIKHETNGGPEAVNILRKAVEKLEIIDGSKGKGNCNSESNIKDVETLTDMWTNYSYTDGYPGWTTGWRKLDEAFDGIPKTDGFLGLAALPNIGKSAYLMNIIINLLQMIDEGYNDDLIIYFMSIDDALPQVLSRMLSIITNIPTKDIKKNSMLDESQRRRIAEAKDKIIHWMRSERLIIADASYTTELRPGIYNMLKTKRRYGNRGCLFVLDNFHKLTDPGKDLRTKNIDLSAALDNLSTQKRFFSITTLELTKMSHTRERPVLGDISETGQIEYDARAILLAQNYLHVDPGTKYRWFADDCDDPLPILEINIGKNKITETKKYLYYNFDPRTSRMTEIENISAYLDESENNNKGGDSNFSKPF